jgi:MoaA/NifB/PqqE/SkfB family radical SAM enzyme
MPFCHTPWTNLDISPTGRITPCCKFNMAKYPTVFMLEEHSIEEYRTSDFLNDVKSKFKNNEWPDGCERCRLEEENNIQSKRQLDYERWQDSYKNYDFDKNELLTAAVAFGNTCNLKCITCHPVASSLWQKEYKDIYKIDVQHFRFYKENFVSDFIKLAPNLIHFDLHGGEPFISGVDEQKELLNHYIQTNQASNITLHYTTNGVMYPDDQWWEIWKHFKEIDMQLSIDGTNQRYEYIRFPGNWDNLVSNVTKLVDKQKILPNLKLSVSHTVSAYNIFYLDEFVRWCYNMKLPKPWMGRVHNPEFMRPSVWPEPARTEIIDHLASSQIKEVQTWANFIKNTNDTEFFEEFKLKTKEHDNYRHLDFAQTFPELGKYLG